MSKDISERIKCLFSICTLMVVYRHSFTIQAFFSDYSQIEWYNCYIEKGISAMTEVAVPFFFVVTGFFFAKYSYNSRIAYTHMLERKVKSLLIPFLMWNTIMLPFYIFKMGAPNTIPLFFYAFLYSDGPLWYIRDIMLFMICVPLYDWIIQKNRWFLQLLIMIPLLFAWLPVHTGICSTEGIVFFLLGMMLKRNNINLDIKVNIYILFFLFVIWIYTCFEIDLWPFDFAHKIRTIGAMLILWNLGCYLRGKTRLFLIQLSKYSFFVYAGHYYFIKTIKISIAYIYPNNSIASLLTFLTTPLLAYAVLYFSGHYIKHYMSSIYSILTGNR